MNSGWRTFGGEERAAADVEVAEAKAELLLLGFPVRGPRFPYAMHHEVYRTRLRRMAGGRTLKHSEVARLLAAWAIERSDPVAYARQAVSGALECLTAGDPALAAKIPPRFMPEAGPAGFASWAAGRTLSGEIDLSG